MTLAAALEFFMRTVLDVSERKESHREDREFHNAPAIRAASRRRFDAGKNRSKKSDSNKKKTSHKKQRVASNCQSRSLGWKTMSHGRQ